MQAQLNLFERMGVKVFAASADAESGARKMIAEQNLTFPVGYGINAEQIEALDAIPGIRQGETIIQPAEFIINPDGEITASMYASTPLGRMNPREILHALKSRVG